MQIQDVVQQWCDEWNAEVDARERKSGVVHFLVFAGVLGLVALGWQWIDTIDFSSWQDGDANAGAFKAALCTAALWGLVVAWIRASDKSETRRSWDALDTAWQVSDELLGRLAAAETVPVSAKAKIAQRLQSHDTVTMAYLEELEAELMREQAALVRHQELAKPGHQSMLRFASTSDVS